MVDFSNFDFEDPTEQGFNFKNNEGFSHESLVMRAETKVQDALMQEMRPGFIEIKKDKLGNEMPIHFPDTRQQSIECITTLLNLMVADIDGTVFQENIKIIFEKIEKKREELIEDQKKWFSSLKYNEQVEVLKKTPEFNPNYFSDKFPYWHSYIEYKMECYREIYEQLEKCLASNKYFKRKRNTNLAVPMEDD